MEGPSNGGGGGGLGGGGGGGGVDTPLLTMEQRQLKSLL